MTLTFYTVAHDNPASVGGGCGKVFHRHILLSTSHIAADRKSIALIVTLTSYPVALDNPSRAGDGVGRGWRCFTDTYFFALSLFP